MATNIYISSLTMFDSIDHRMARYVPAKRPRVRITASWTLLIYVMWKLMNSDIKFKMFIKPTETNLILIYEALNCLTNF